MSSFSIQFHAALDDLSSFAKVCLRTKGVHCVAVHVPFRVEELREDGVDETLRQESVQSLIFTEGAPILSSASGNQLLDKNTGCLVLDVGRLRERDLEESCLGTLRASSTWKKLAAELKRRTTAGAVGIHETTGASARYRSHRFTNSAKLMHEQGIALRQFAQSPVLFHPES
jgi:hypothetical protein